MNNRKNKDILGKDDRYCFYCTHPDMDVDYKDIKILKRYISSFGKIVPRRKSGLCSLHQRKVAKAIKRARQMALMSYTSLD